MAESTAALKAYKEFTVLVETANAITGKPYALFGGLNSKMKN